MYIYIYMYIHMCLYVWYVYTIYNMYSIIVFTVQRRCNREQQPNLEPGAWLGTKSTDQSSNVNRSSFKLLLAPAAQVVVFFVPFFFEAFPHWSGDRELKQSGKAEQCHSGRELCAVYATAIDAYNCPKARTVGEILHPGVAK